MRSLLLAAGIVCLQLAFLLFIYAEGTHRWLTGPLIMAAGAGLAFVAVRRRSGGRS